MSSCQYIGRVLKDVDQKLDDIKFHFSQLEQKLDDKEWTNKSYHKEKNIVVFGLKESLKKSFVDKKNDDMNELVRMFDWLNRR